MPDNPMPEPSMEERLNWRVHTVTYWLQTTITAPVIAAFLAGVLVGIALS